MAVRLKEARNEPTWELGRLFFRPRLRLWISHPSLALAAMCFLLFALCFAIAFGHGSLRTPEPRDIVQNVGVTDGGMDAPVGSDPMLPGFRCRNLAPGAPVITIRAGDPLVITTNIMQVPHVGDCAVYLNLAGSLNTDPTTGWFKIANIPDCRISNTDTITVPAWIKPSAHAILRWEWYALHIYPNAEFYAQCVDVQVLNTRPVAEHGDPNVTVSIPGHLPSPSATQYRNPFATPLNLSITGPPVAIRVGGAVENNNNGAQASTTPRQTCVQNLDCPSNVCQVDGFCFVSSVDDSGIGPGGIAAVIFALLFVGVAVALVLVLLRLKSSGSASSSARYEPILAE